MDFIKQYVIPTILYDYTGNDIFDDFIWYTSFFMEFAAVFGIILLILRNKPLRKRTRTEDKMLFVECIMVMFQNVLDISLVPMVYIDTDFSIALFDISLVVNEVLYFLIILQWLICIDYSLHHSIDHIKRRYFRAAIPIVVITALETLQYVLVVYMVGESFLDYNVLQAGKLFVEFCYVATAVYIEKRHEKQSREPRFMRLSAFIIPFVIGVLVRFYDAPLLALGVILTYQTMKRRDSFIDDTTGLYNEAYLDHLAAYWDKKGYSDSSAIIVSAPGNGEAASQLVREYKIPDCYNIALANERFVFFTESLRDSAAQMAMQLLKEGAAGSPVPFRVGVKCINRIEGQSALEFADQIKKEAEFLFPASKGDSQAT